MFEGRLLELRIEPVRTRREQSMGIGTSVRWAGNISERPFNRRRGRIKTRLTPRPSAATAKKPSCCAIELCTSNMLMSPIPTTMIALPPHMSNR